MKVILGLGNPGVEYQNTRHNAGILFVETLGSDFRKHYNALVCKTPNFILIKTKDVFMNESGKLITSPSIPLLSLGEGSRRQGEVWIAHDDLDLRLGEYKIQKGVGPRLHYGVQSVEQTLGTKDFWRIRIGIDNRAQGSGLLPAGRQGRAQGEDYVLQRFTNEERKILNQVFEKIKNEIAQTNIK